MSQQKRKTLVNTETKKSVDVFLSKVKHKGRKEDAFALLKIMQEITGLKAKVWGVSIIAFGKYEYQRKNGETYEWFHVGFSPGSKHLSVYLMFDLTKEPLLKKLGPHTHGKGCLYIKHLSDINMDVLKQLIEKSDRWVRESK